MLKKARKRPYVKVVISATDPKISIREVLFLQVKPVEFEESGYIIGPFKTNGAAKLYKANVDKYKTVAAAEKAFARFGFKGDIS